jgi:DNA repair exonuclease SbcCD ATPase subunit
LKKENKSLSKKIIELRDKHLEKKLHLENIKKRSTIHQSGLTLTSVNELIEEIEKEKQSLLESINKNNEKIKDKKDVLIKISDFKLSYPIDDLKESNEKILLLTDKFDKISNDLKTKREKRKSFNERIKILDDIPCDDLFPKCKFIKDANESKNDLDELKDKITAQEADYYEINNILSTFDSEAVRSKIKKYDDILNKEYRAKVDVESINNSIDLTNSQLKDINKNIEKYEKIKEEILSISTVDHSKEEKILHDEIVLTNREILNLENDKEKNIVDLTVLKTELKRHVDEEKEYKVLLQKWKIYDIFNYCVSKKGIPTKLIESALPKINMEIHKILQNITNFTVELHADTSNNLDIYLDYGDSKRIIECCSGMEKMMASLAVRVALINMSILPRSDVFIIDEGFGSLDELNLASCSRFIKNLKSWFKTIIIISHVEEIKDIVDNSIVIKTSGKDSHVVFE